MSDQYHRYEAWVLDVGSNPTISVLAIVYILLVIVTLPSLKSSLPSVQAYFAFALVNALTWSYFAVASDWFSPAWQLHIRVLILHLLIVSGIGLVLTLIGRYIFGFEEPVRIVAPGYSGPDRRTGPADRRRPVTE